MATEGEVKKLLNPTPGCAGECKSCPMATKEYSPEGEYGYNMGCLPGYAEAKEWYNDAGKVWACHSNNNRPCGGFLNMSRSNDVDVFEGKLITEEASLDDIYDGK